MTDNVTPPAAEPKPELTAEQQVDAQNPVPTPGIDLPAEPKPEPDALTVSQKEFNAQYHKTKQLEREQAALQAKFDEQGAQLKTYQETGTQDYGTQGDDAGGGDIKEQVSRAVAEALGTQQKQQQAQTEKQRQDSVAKTFNERATAYATANPDYNKAIESATNVVYPAHVQAAILESERGAELDHLLLSNPQILNELEGMTSSRALMRIGQLEAQFNGKQQQTTQAPAPFDTGGGGGAGSMADEDLDMQSLYDKTMSKRGF